MPLFDTHIIVDWSARSKPSPAKPTKDAIWWAVARVDSGSASVLKPKYARTRDDALRCLVRLIADELDTGRRVLVGFDFPFGYPEGVAAHLTGKGSALALWDWLAERVDRMTMPGSSTSTAIPGNPPTSAERRASRPRHLPLRSTTG